MMFVTYFKLYSTRSKCVTEDSNDTRPGTEKEEGATSGSTSVLFGPAQSGCLISPPLQKLGASGSLTLAVWMKPSSSGEM